MGREGGIGDVPQTNVVQASSSTPPSSGGGHSFAGTATVGSNVVEV